MSKPTPMEELAQIIDSLGQQSNDWRVQIGLSLTVVLVLWALRWLAVRLVERRTDNAELRYRWRKSTAYTTYVLVILVVGSIWFEHVKSISTFLGLLTAGLAIALRDIVASVAGWIFILVRRPFDVGDRIEIAGFQGDVIDIRIFKFTLNEIGGWVEADQSTGRITHLPNSLILSEAVVNYIRGFPFIWNEIKIVVTFESDWRRAKEILTELLETHTLEHTRQAERALPKSSEKYLLHFRHLTPIVYTALEEYGVELSGRHICPPRQRRSVTQLITEGLLDALAGVPGIELAYPTTRIFQHPRESRLARPGGPPTPPDPFG